MKRIIAVLSLVLVLALSLTACGGKKDYKAETKEFKFDKLTITLSESFEAGREVKNDENELVSITYTSSTGTGVTIDKIGKTITAQNDLDALNEIYASEEAKNKNNVKGSLTIHEHGDKKDKILTDKNGMEYYVFTLKADGSEYTYLKAIVKSGDYAYGITFSTTKSSYEGKDDYKTHFLTWLESATITTPTETPAE